MIHHEKQSVLRIHKATISHPATGEIVATDWQMNLHRGDFVMILLERDVDMSALADACCGLEYPDRGSVLFMRHDWQHMSTDDSNAMRGTIGRVFGKTLFLPHITVEQNILLPHLHHTKLPIEQLRQEALIWCNRVGLPGIPTERQNKFHYDDLKRATWARAFLGEPNLVILENPMHNIIDDGLEELLNAIQCVRQQNTAVCWLTQNHRMYDNDKIQCTQRFCLKGVTMSEAVS